MTVLFTRRIAGRKHESPGAGGDERHRLSVIGGIAALSLDAMSSVAYGPEAIVIVLTVAGGAGLGYTVPITLAIAGLLGVLTLSYRQVIAAFPEGGGAYGVAKTYLGRRASLLAAASLVVDYVLNVAVSIAAGVAALTSAFPRLLPYTLWLCLAVLLLVTAINLRGIAHSARLFIVPTAIFVLSILAVIVVGLSRSGPVSVQHSVAQAHTLQTVGLLLLLRAFANGCAALTGVEAIANAIPSFRKPRVKRAQRAEVALGALLGIMLIGIATLISKFHIHPAGGVTVLSQVTAGSLGHGIGYYVVQFSTVVLLALAANTSFGGMPVLAQLLAKDNNLPHLFALRAERQVHRYGIYFLAATGALLLIGTDGDMNTLVPLFAIGVFVGFTLSQAGMVRHWWTARPYGWRPRAALNGFGALLTGLAAIIVTTTKFTEGGWLIVATMPLMVLLMSAIHRAYDRIGQRLELDRTPARPRPRRSLVIVPIGGVNRLTQEAMSAALSIGDRVVALRVTHPDEPEETKQFIDAWERWAPDINLALVNDNHRRLVEPIVEYLRGLDEPKVFVLIPEVEPAHMWQRVLQNQRGAVLAHALRRDTDVVVCRLRFRLENRTTPNAPTASQPPA
jgi:amino acid transporter